MFFAAPYASAGVSDHENHIPRYKTQVAVTVEKYKYTSREWKSIVRKSPDSFFRTDEAVRIAENVLDYQRVTGGWPKNIAIHEPLGDRRNEVLEAKKRRTDSTTDNDATILEMTYLARLYHQRPDERYKQAFMKAVDFLLDGQYDNGGWPQFWPENRGDYQTHITYNDNAMVQTLTVIRDLRDGKTPFDIITDKAIKKRLAKAFDKGVECILNTQIIVNGEPTVWCQQHDSKTLAPAKARAYELPSFCSAESASLVYMLMEIPNPDSRVKAAVNGAMKWFENHKLTGIKVVRFIDSEGKSDTKVVEDAGAEPIWARYYDLEEAEPMFCDRDGVPRRTLAEIGRERRGGYGWYSNSPAYLYPEYEKWKKKYNM
ncbi:pectate lyase [Prevotella sp. PMUR]|uniref:Pectate lyase n=2 Tax=Xylanibacter muris TaxID=2736290 RepID=A0ABX2AJ06_9BACT|nr:pectate lyase [Xylanibacter muris]